MITLKSIGCTISCKLQALSLIINIRYFVSVYMSMNINFFFYFCCSEFCTVVRKIFIYTPEEVKKLSPKIGLPINEVVKPSKVDSEAAVNSDDQSSTVGPSC